MRKILRILLFLVLVCGCSKKDNEINQTPVSNFYFPEINSEEWDATLPEELSWNSTAIDDLNGFLEQNNTRAFIVLKEGKIVLENYWGNDDQETAVFNKNSSWPWYSAGKTLTAFLVGIAQENGLLSIEDSSSNFLGSGWTSLSDNQEIAIKIKHQLTMTTGLDYHVDDLNCTEPNCLIYRNAPGTQWFYHNASYSLLKEVIENASQTTYNIFSNQSVESKIGMSGNWIESNYNMTYLSSARDMARFGLLVLNRGIWKEEVILNDTDYFSMMTNTSQTLNESYGYLWWLNGKNSLIPPGFTIPVGRSLTPNAPDDMIAGLGKDGQYLDIVPSQDLVIIRMGGAPEDSEVSNGFHDEMWRYINEVIDE